MSSELSSPRRGPRGGVFGRLSVGHVIMILAGLLAVLVNFALLRSRDEAFLVAVAGNDLGRGAIASAAAFRFAEVQVDSEILTTLITPDELSDYEGLIVSRSVADGELISKTDFVQAAAPMEQRAMSIPVDRVHAAGGAITDADSVDVIGVFDGLAEYIVLAAPVLDVAATSSSGIGSSGQYYVTVAVDSLTALRIASAMSEGSLEIVRSTGASEPTQLVYPEQLDDPSNPEGESDAGS